MSHERAGASDEWYTPKYIFDALGVIFDMDVASCDPPNPAVPAKEFITRDSLSVEWSGVVWMNPPFGKRNGLWPWLERFVAHGNGIALTPDRTSAEWWQYMAGHCPAILFVSPKVKFHRPNGSVGKSPSNGVTLFGIGEEVEFALHSARKLGVCR